MSHGVGILSDGGHGEDLQEAADAMEVDHVFMEEYRTQRLREMQNNLPIAGRKAAEGGERDPTAVSMLRRPEFGTCYESGGEGWYIKEVEDENARVTIVVHIYNPRDPMSKSINEQLDSIATTWSHIKFVKLQATMCGIKIDPSKLPIISVYKDKKLISAIKNFRDELMGRGSGTCTKEDVEWLLESSDNWTATQA
jgi:hypothetical protein